MLLKTITIFFTILTATHAQDVMTRDSSWSRLLQAKKERKVSFSVPQFNLGSSYFYKATDVCLSGPELSVIEPIKIKHRMKCIRRYGDKCKREIKVFPRMNVEGRRYGCMVRKVEDDKLSPCLMWGMVPYTTKTSFEVQVYELEGTVEIPLFTKELKLPACKDVD